MSTENNEHNENHEATEHFAYSIDGMVCGVSQYLQLDNNQYGSGTRNSTATLIASQIAKKHSEKNSDTPVTFIDPHYQSNKPGEDSLIESIKNAKGPIFFGTLDLDKDSTNTTGGIGALKTIVEKCKDKDFIITLGLTDPKEIIIDGKKEVNRQGHSISLIKKGDEILIIEQGTGENHQTDKNRINEVISNAGMNSEYFNMGMENDNDCAIFAAMINEWALEYSNINELTEKLTKYQQTQPVQSKQEEIKTLVDIRNQKYKTYATEALIAHALTLSDEKFKEIFGKTKDEFKGMDFEHQMSYIRNINLSMNVDEHLPDTTNEPGWKDDIRKAVNKTNEKLKYNFEEYTDENNPNHLYFKDKNKPNNIIGFSSPFHSYVQGDQDSFDLLVASAKELGRDAIAFGKFEKHPEYKAKLYLACLKHGLKITGNIPTEEELKAYPEYEEISTTRDEESGKFKEELKKLDDQIKTILEPTDEDKRKNKEFYNILDTLHTKKDKKELDEAKNSLLKHSLGIKLQELAQEKAQLYADYTEKGIIPQNTAEEALSPKTSEKNEQTADSKKPNYTQECNTSTLNIYNRIRAQQQK